MTYFRFHISNDKLCLTRFRFGISVAIVVYFQQLRNKHKRNRLPMWIAAFIPIYPKDNGGCINHHAYFRWITWNLIQHNIAVYLPKIMYFFQYFRQLRQMVLKLRESSLYQSQTQE